MVAFEGISVEEGDPLFPFLFRFSFSAFFLLCYFLPLPLLRL
jgi:hypothetical protein